MPNQGEGKIWIESIQGEHLIRLRDHLIDSKSPGNFHFKYLIYNYENYSNKHNFMV